MPLSVGDNGLHTILRKLELFGDFGHAHAIVVVIDDRTDRHPRAAQHRRTALDPRVNLDQRVLRPIDLYLEQP